MVRLPIGWFVVWLTGYVDCTSGFLSFSFVFLFSRCLLFSSQIWHTLMHTSSVIFPARFDKLSCTRHVFPPDLTHSCTHHIFPPDLIHSCTRLIFPARFDKLSCTHHVFLPDLTHSHAHVMFSRQMTHSHAHVMFARKIWHTFMHTSCFPARSDTLMYVIFSRQIWHFHAHVMFSPQIWHSHAYVIFSRQIWHTFMHTSSFSARSDTLMHTSSFSARSDTFMHTSSVIFPARFGKLSCTHHCVSQVTCNSADQYVCQTGSQFLVFLPPVRGREILQTGKLTEISIYTH